MRGQGKIGILLSLFVPLATGCGGVDKRKNDPLLGNQPTLPEKGSVARANTEKDKPLPGLPAPKDSTSPASLASGAVAQLDGSRDLRLSDKGDPADTWRKTNSGVSLGNPKPVTDDKGGIPEMKPTLPPVPVAPPGGTGFMTARETTSTDAAVLRALEQRGMKGFKLEQVKETGQWRGIVSIPNPQNPAFKQTYDATGADAQSALRAILDQIDQERRQ